MALLEVKELSVEFNGFKAVDHISYDVEQGQVVGIVGESGSGKSVSSLAIMGLIDFPGKVTAEALHFDTKNLQQLTSKMRRKIVGADVAMIFQDPMTSLNPCFTIGYQIIETLKIHQGGSKRALKARAIELLKLVGIPDAENRLSVYPHQLSGGMSQRVMIAIAIACNPKLLIADEPTTALDVTIQGQIIELLLELQRKNNMALVLITHDLALVSEAAQKIIVMYAGQVVEIGDAEIIFKTPLHPYTQALLRSLPEFTQDKERLESLSGVVPGKYDRPVGCLLNPRCPYATERCNTEEPTLISYSKNRKVKCHYPLSREGTPQYEQQ
ncbi:MULTISPECIES: dipeptide ABC transporter ATP-binding protein [unclassified Gilliamella]|uniref:dipeptide ABC transporter ATP-binding protein n=1 Tax=unclassified Gilliamella TaxID=2685620 RepID=UPI00226A1341|nr:MULTISPECIES: dipeptide ABC transporter ATP-binding protein [unclassified Gilliamella]MCX8601700.1 dipeptide ABC transporter ATP-binding protein [Gilliamella sp. B3722]MCX8607898.1 dipeptide ABC transporter ATP-binding protein [Gilliamella sp. B3771]MCX8610963.1 dipeptide ABC transporter ATP-binding protein [Gilliamella sp. B3891]MCX8613431.1 dipeptide ABC transporter ATP-binding protein [Gilliamella sp. B3773]MCX8615274.1 dipeptide ABC transporter ATP-binding protein [Gilliamella sp. B3770